MRWLLVMDSTPNPAGTGFAYRLWLSALDSNNQAATRFDTVEELYAALFARGQQPRQDSGEAKQDWSAD